MNIRTIIYCLLLLSACAKTQNRVDGSTVDDSGLAGARHLIESCGPPVAIQCTSPVPSANTTGLPLCTSEAVGNSCTQALGENVCVVDPGFQCPAIGYNQGPTFLYCGNNGNLGMCPISSAKAKDNIQYLSAQDRQKITREILDLRLSHYSYKPGFATDRSPQLGFIIEDLPQQSPLVNSKREFVNLYGYISSVVATVQEQNRLIEDLKKEVAELKKRKR